VAQEIQGEFDDVVWRSLRNGPALKDLLADLLELLSDKPETDLREHQADRAVRKPVSYSRLQEEIQIEESKEDLGKALASLGRRSLLEKVKEGKETLFELQPMVKKYVRSQLS